jgi:hypothetical protein
MLILIIIWYICYLNWTCTVHFSATLRNMLPIGSNCNVRSVVYEHFLLEFQ